MMQLYRILSISLGALLMMTPPVTATELESAPETTIIVIDSMEPGQTFPISTTQQIRIPTSAIAGTTITVKISGPAQIAAHYRIVPMKENTGPDGKKTLQPLIGTTEHEYLLQPTGTGEVTVTLTARSPIPRIEPQVKQFHFTVE